MVFSSFVIVIFCQSHEGIFGIGSYIRPGFVGSRGWRCYYASRLSHRCDPNSRSSRGLYHRIYVRRSAKICCSAC